MHAEGKRDAAGRAGPGRIALEASPLPHTILGAGRLLDESGTVSAERVANLVRHDPAVVSAVLRVANSAHYGTGRTVLGIERAVHLLGPVTVLGIVTGLHLSSPPSPASESSGACFLRLVRHCVAVGYLAETLGRRVANPWPDDVTYTAGLLHDLGRILIANADPASARGVYGDGSAVAADSDAELLDVEQVAFGYDHTEAGGLAAGRFGFPDLLVAAIRHHHRPGAAGPDPQAVRLARLIGLADAAANALGWPARGDRPMDTFEGHEAWSHLEFRDVSTARDAVLRRADFLRSGADLAA